MTFEYTLELLLDFGTDGSKLVPVVTQDVISKDVLLLAFANRLAFDKTIETGCATYWSRSRNKLWTKGEESGNYLLVQEIRINCEQNSLLYLVKLVGIGACHAKNKSGTPYTSCYYRRIKQGALEFIY